MDLGTSKPAKETPDSVALALPSSSEIPGFPFKYSGLGMSQTLEPEPLFRGT